MIPDFVVFVVRGHGGPFRAAPDPGSPTRPSGAPRRTGVGTRADQSDPDLTQKIGQNLRFTTLAALANELQEAQGNRELARVVGRYARTELLILDELGYLALLDGAAELVFQVLFERHKRGCLIVTTNLQFGEWTKVFPDPRLAKAVADRLTHRAHVIDTGNESWRFRHGLTKTKQT